MQDVSSLLGAKKEACLDSHVDFGVVQSTRPPPGQLDGIATASLQDVVVLMGGKSSEDLPSLPGEVLTPGRHRLFTGGSALDRTF